MLKKQAFDKKFLNFIKLKEILNIEITLIDSKITIAFFYGVFLMFIEPRSLPGNRQHCIRRVVYAPLYLFECVFLN